MKLAITYATVTPESAEHGETEEQGFEVDYEDGWTLREAIKFMHKQNSGMYSIEPSCFHLCDNGHCWVSVWNTDNPDEDTEYSLHIKNVTVSTHKRILRLLLGK